MAEQEQDRSEPATPQKLRDARRRGQVAKSVEVNSVVIVATTVSTLYLTGDRVVRDLLLVVKSLLSNAHSMRIDPVGVMNLYQSLVIAMLAIFGMFVAAIVLSGVLGNILQTGPVFSLVALKPDLNKLNPVQGFKRIFSIRTVFDAGKTIAKVALVGLVGYSFIVDALPGAINLVNIDPRVYVRDFSNNAGALIIRLLGLFFFIVVLDIVFAQWQFRKQMRMSQREVKEEVKRREGDPHVKSKMRRLQRDAVKRRGSIRRVKDADVVITNPTRLAVAIRFIRGEMRAPEVVSMGAGNVATTIRWVARRYRIPVVENRVLARELYRRTSIDDPVPEDLFPVVAKILVWAFSVKDGDIGSGARHV